MNLSISPEDRDLILLEAEREYPRECCGFLVGSVEKQTRTVTRVLRAENRHSLANRYLLSPEDYLRAELAARDEGAEVIGFYHSHPDSNAVPSVTDARESLPGLTYMIVSVREGHASELRTWTRRANGFHPETVETGT